jgi:hypothetical protein
MLIRSMAEDIRGMVALMELMSWLTADASDDESSSKIGTRLEREETL